jgi:hypothetical protein
MGIRNEKIQFPAELVLIKLLKNKSVFLRGDKMKKYAAEKWKKGIMVDASNHYPHAIESWAIAI